MHLYIFFTAIKEAADLVGIDWRAVAKKLGFRKTDIDSIVHNHQHCLKSQIDEFFATWRSRSKGEDPQEMCGKLRQALQDSGLCAGDSEVMDQGDSTKGCDADAATAFAAGQCGARVEADGPMFNPAHSSSSAKGGGGQGSKATPPPRPQPPPPQLQPPPPQQWSHSAAARPPLPVCRVVGGADGSHAQVSAAAYCDTCSAFVCTFGSCT